MNTNKQTDKSNNKLNEWRIGWGICLFLMIVGLIYLISQDVSIIEIRHASDPLEAQWSGLFWVIGAIETLPLLVVAIIYAICTLKLLESSRRTSITERRVIKASSAIIALAGLTHFIMMSSL